MNEDFVSFDLARKLKEKVFSCEMPFAMYNEIGQFYLLTTSAPYHVCESGYKYREYYNYEDFDEHDYVAPTISQVLNWLRKEKKILVVAAPEFLYREARYFWQCGIYKISFLPNVILFHKFIDYQESHESAILAGIEYVIDNLI